MRILIIDNYDSFTFNLYQLVGEVLELSETNFSLEVKKNDTIYIKEIKNMHFDRIIISPGPGEPSDKKYFGVCGRVILELGRRVPMLGVCLGMQGIAHCFGGKIVRAREPRHGKTSIIMHNQRGIFAGLPQGLEVMRYHSLVVEDSSLPSCLEITARVKSIGGSSGEIMALRHKIYPIEGVQFHPESFATEGGLQMMSNFLLRSGYEKLS